MYWQVLRRGRSLILAIVIFPVSYYLSVAYYHSVALVITTQ